MARLCCPPLESSRAGITVGFLSSALKGVSDDRCGANGSVNGCGRRIVWRWCCCLMARKRGTPRTECWHAGRRGLLADTPKRWRVGRLVHCETVKWNFARRAPSCYTRRVAQQINRPFWSQLHFFSRTSTVKIDLSGLRPRQVSRQYSPELHITWHMLSGTFGFLLEMV